MSANTWSGAQAQQSTEIRVGSVEQPGTLPETASAVHQHRVWQGEGQTEPGTELGTARCHFRAGCKSTAKEAASRADMWALELCSHQ